MKYFFLMSLSLLSLSAFAQEEKPLKGIIETDISKCPDGSAKETLKMGRLNKSFSNTYIAKSNNQDFVVILPDGSVNLYYCAPKRIIYVDGKQKSQSVPVLNYAFNLGNLKDRNNCEFSDLLSGNIALRFEGSYYQTNISVRAVMESDKEKAEYKKLCTNQENVNSFRMQDSKVGSAQ